MFDQAQRQRRRDVAALAIGDTALEWTTIPLGVGDSVGWQHSGVAALDDGAVLVAHPEGHHLVHIDRHGHSRMIPTPLTEMHYLTTASAADGTTVVWAADNGHRFVHDAPDYGEITAAGRVVALDAEGRVVRELTDPAAAGPWSPTSIALTDPFDPSTDIWVADGYGQNLIHKFAADGTHLLSIDAAETGTTLACPHGIVVRGNELYVADRTNKRILAFDLAGAFLRVIADDAILDSPSSMVEYGRYLLVTELFGAIAVFDGDAYIGHIGASMRSHEEPAWPNTYDAQGNTVAPALHQGRFNSPHGITVQDGAVYLTEWLVGGRVVRLNPTQQNAKETR